jgi:hypothetical protein
MSPHHRITIAVIITILSSCNFSFSQKNVGVKGSFLIAAFSSDGIIVATDSRGVFYDTDLKDINPLAYFDYVAKSFVIGNCVVAETGNALYGNMFLCKIIEEFKKEYPKPMLVSKLLSNLLFFCETHMDKKTFDMFKKNKLIVAGYEKGTPLICYYEDGETKCIKDNFIQSGSSNFNKLYNKNLNSKQLSLIATNAINDYAKKSNQTYIIGGEISVSQITEKGVFWIQNTPKCQWDYIESMLLLVRENKVKLNYTSQKNKKALDALLKKNYPNIFK